MSMALEFFWQNSLVAMPTAVEFSTWVAMGPCFRPISERVVRIGTAVWELTKMVPYSASAADAIIFHMILHTTSNMPLVVGTKYSGLSGSGGTSLRKWTPLARLLARANERYDASECMDNCTPLDIYWIYACGLEARQFKILAICFAVFVVALDCSEEMSLRAGRIVLLIAME